MHARGLRFRKDYRIDTGGVRVRADVAFPRTRIAIFLDGCFWHQCPIHATQPKSNAAFWAEKLQRNVDRDRRVRSALTDSGWTVVRVWEHERADTAACRIEAVVRSLVEGAGSC